MRYLLPLILILLSFELALGQEQSQYNHYVANQGLLNPAYNGTRDVISGIAIHRSQWIGMKDAPMNQAINVHGPIEDTNLGVGVVLENDNLGFRNNFNFMAAGSYKLQLGRRGEFLSLGLQVGLSSNVYDGTKAITDQFGDPMFQRKESILGFNFGVGAYYYTDRYFAGLAVPRFFSPSFGESESNGSGGFDGSYKNTVSFENLHSYWYGGYIFDWGDVKVKPTALIRTVVGAPLTFDLSANVLLNEQIWLGVSYRSISEMVFLAEYILNRQFTIRYSFDYSLSALSTAAKYGSHEIGIQFDFSFNRRAGMRSIRYF